MYKAIVFIRTSTDSQEMESQRLSTLQFCKYDGYTDDEIKVIGTNGASAIKLDQLYLQDIDEIYRTIETNPIEGIYLFAVDRLGRNEPILVGLKQFCIDNKIHLKIKDLGISLLNADKTLNEGSNIMLSVLAAQAASEMRIKKARFERARVRNYEQGKYMGGYIPYGYYVDDKGYYQINEEEAKLIRLIYSLYLSRKFSADTLARELNERGYRNGKGRMFNPQYVRLLLKSPTYSGETVDVSGRKMVYPPIVTKEDQAKAKEILLSNNTAIDKARVNFYFGNKLILCPECGHHFERKSGVYTCCGRQLARRAGQSHICNCNNSLSVAINCTDGILWDLTKRELIKDLESDNNSKEVEAREKIDITIQKLTALGDKLAKYQEKIEEIYLEGDRKMLSEKFIDKRVSVVKKQQEQDNIRLAELQSELSRYQQVLENVNQHNKFLTSYNSITEVELQGNEKKMSELVHQYVHQVIFEKSNYNNSDKYVLMNIQMKNGMEYKVWFNGRIKKGSRAFIWDSDYNYEREYDFYNIERTENGITHKGIEKFKRFISAAKEYLTTHTMQQLMDELNTDCELHRLFTDCGKDNLQQVIHTLNALAINN